MEFLFNLRNSVPLCFFMLFYFMDLKTFSDVLDRDFASVLNGQRNVAVAVSGGPDSMALLHLMREWAQGKNVIIHALHVDHGLREASAQEARQVQDIIETWDDVRFALLSWAGVKPESALQEEARRARYALLSEYCNAQGISTLFLAHHMDDQVETFLFRLAKGSGLDGLAGMRPQQIYGEGLTLCRPLLDIEKSDLVALCEEKHIAYLKDPSNENSAFARVRLRKSREVLEAEGFSGKRLSKTASRLLRARVALEQVTETAFKNSFLNKNTNRIEFNFNILNSWPEEIVLRVVLKAMEEIGPIRDYGPRMENLEALIYDLRSPQAFRKRTLGGVIFERDDESRRLILNRE